MKCFDEEKVYPKAEMDKEQQRKRCELGEEIEGRQFFIAATFPPSSANTAPLGR